MWSGFNMSKNSIKSITCYLVGGMEHVAKLGGEWRDMLTPNLQELGFSVLNPCEFEPEQLKGLHVLTKNK